MTNGIPVSTNPDGGRCGHLLLHKNRYFLDLPSSYLPYLLYIPWAYKVSQPHQLVQNVPCLAPASGGSGFDCGKGREEVLKPAVGAEQPHNLTYPSTCLPPLTTSANCIKEEQSLQISPVIGSSSYSLSVCLRVSFFAVGLGNGFVQKVDVRRC